MALEKTKKIAALAALLLGVALPATADTLVHVLCSEPGPVEQKALLSALAKEYSDTTPGVTVQIDFMDTESFKKKLPTMLQSDARPDIFYSWGGGVLADQASAGFVSDLSDAVRGDWASEYSAAGIDAFTIDGKIVGVPVSASDIGFWVNKPLAMKAGIDLGAIRTWDDFLAAVQKAKDVGITPIILGAKDKWPVHFYLAYLAVREAGKSGFTAAMAGEGDGFASAPFLKAATEFKRLIDMQPFQPGFANTDFNTASGMFGDGVGVFHLMGDWDYGAAKSLSHSKQGIPDQDLAWMRFPAVDGGAGNASDTFGGINGWVVTSNASSEALNFLKWFNSPDVQKKNAAAGYYIPVAKGADASLTNPFFQKISQALAQSNYHQIFLDQSLGADVGATFNDASTDLALGAVSPQEAVQQIQDAWAMR